MRFIGKINWRIVSILLAWIVCAAAVWMLLTPRPFVIEKIARYWVSDDGNWLATCTMQTPAANARATIWDLRTFDRHYEFDFPDRAEEGWFPRRAIFAPSGKLARFDGVLVDLVQKTHQPSMAEHPEFRHIPFENIFFDEQDRLIARWDEEYWNVAEKKLVAKIVIPRDWHSACPRGHLHYFQSEKATTIVDFKNRSSVEVNVPDMSAELGFCLAPTGDYYGYFGLSHDYWLFSTDGKAPKKIPLRTEYDAVNISPHGVYLLACVQGGDPDGWLNRVLAKLDIWPPSEQHLIDASTGEGVAALSADNPDWVDYPFFSPDNALLFAFDPYYGRLSIWTLPVNDRPLLKMALLMAISLIAAIAVFKSFRRRAI